MAYKYAYDEENVYVPPKKQTDRKMWKLMLFNIFTLGFYSIFFFIPFAFDLDDIAPKSDRSKTFNYFLAYILASVTGTIVLIVWHYHIAERVEDALKRCQIDYEFGTGTFWSWYFLGSFILIGPFVYFHKLCTAMNLLCEYYNNNPVTK